ncbi:MAG: segregation/condensation protein A [Verrucomicrobia bacterium]|nr:segregation/condensation protein A [Verrucomicrobiota bacterium]
MIEYKVKFEVFEGPLDLLLYLIKKEEVDIYEVNLTRLATQFLEYLEVMRLLDLDIAGEFLVMAATLMYIKSRELLPRDQQVLAEGDDDLQDPRWELIRKLVEYKKFKDAAVKLQARELDQENTFPRLPAKPEFGVQDALARADVSLFDLLNAVNAVLKRVGEREQLRDVFDDRWTVTEKIDHLLRVTRERSSVLFSELFAHLTSRSEVVVTFLALLELIRLRQIVATQSEPFGDIRIMQPPRTAPLPAGSEAPASDPPRVAPAAPAAATETSAPDSSST